MSAGQLAVSPGTVLEPARSTQHPVSVLLYNTDSGSETVTLRVTPSDGTIQTVFQAALAAGEHAVVSNLILGPGDTVTGYAGTGAKVNYLVTPLHPPVGPPGIFVYDASGALKQVNSGVSGSQTVGSRLTAGLLAVGPAPTDTYAATMTIDVTKSLHVIAAANGTSATVAFTPSGAGAAGDLLTIITEADGSGTVTATFASTFHPSGTQVTTLSHFSSIVFESDGTRWVEVCRTTNLA